MRLLEYAPEGSIRLTDDLRDNEIPHYAILSHTWGPNAQEVTFGDLIGNTGERKAGYNKIRFCAEQARRDNLQYFWVDTCCIDKSNNTELHEAINSMFRWYQNSARCYVYLSDVSVLAHQHDPSIQKSQLEWEAAFRASAWFTRGWTLQELLAPSSVEFFTKDGQRLGDKGSLEQLIHQVTGIAIPALRGADALAGFDVRERFKWAEGRRTTREEDSAYCLLGMFGVFLPLLYGEGRENAHRRLKKEIADAMDRGNESVLSRGFTARTLPPASSVARSEATWVARHQEETELLQWIGNPKITSGSVHSPFPGTGNWLLNSAAYQKWASGNGPSTLWCHGPPGVGKSMLASVALQHLTKSLENEPVCLLHYFCDFANRKAQKKEDVWKSLMRQAIAQVPAPILDTLASSRGRLGRSRPASPGDLSDALDTVCANQQVVLVFDGPDELEHVKDAKTILAPFLKANCRMLVTSRDLPEIRAALTTAEVLEVQADKGDLRAYVVGQFEENDLEDILESQPSLETEIVHKSNGIFLLVRILMDHLISLATVKEMRNALQSYPAHLNEAFESCLERINAQSPSHRSLAHRVMGWLASAQRKLLLSELIHGLATEDEVDVIDEGNLAAPKTILKVCGGLVAANTGDGTVAMVHATVYAWFCNRDNALFHGDMARSCLRYLTLRPLSAGSATTAEEMDQRIKSLPFLSYAAQNWAKHVLDVAMESSLTDAINSLLDNADFRSAALQASNYRNQLKDFAAKSAAFEAMSTGHSSLHGAAHWNLRTKTSAIIADGQDVNARDSQHWTPLHWASFSKSSKAASILVSHGAGLDTLDSVGWTPIFWAALHGETAIVKLLLEHGANHLVRDIHGWTVVRWAAARQQTEVVNILLRHHNDNTPSSRPSSSLKAASDAQADLHCSANNTQGGDLIDELLLDQPEKGHNGREFVDLYSVLGNESFDISQLWNIGHFDPPLGNIWRTMNKAEMAGGADGYIGWSAPDTAWKTRLLHKAIRDDKFLAVRLLVELGADVNGNMARTSLHAAAFRKNPSFAEFLLDHGADTESTDYQGLTPLQQAVVNGFEETIKLLLLKGANVNAICREKLKGGSRLISRAGKRGTAAACKSALMLACGLRQPQEDVTLPTRIVRLLIEHGADVNMKDAETEGMSAIHYAAHSRNPEILKTIMNAGANSKALDTLGRTAIHHLVLGVEDHQQDAGLFDSEGHHPPGMATSSLTLLRQKCGVEFFSQTAEWMVHYRSSGNTWMLAMSVHTALSLSIVVEDWEIFEALYRLSATFQSTAPLDAALNGCIAALQPAAVDLLLENGATFPTRDPTWINDVYIMSSSHQIQPDETQRLTAILAKLLPHGLDINEPSGWCCQETILHRVVERSGSCELTQDLLGFGADPYRQNGRHGLDSFLLAGLNQNHDTLRYMLEHVKTRDGDVAVYHHWTRSLDYSKIIQDCDMVDEICAAIEKAGLIDFFYNQGNVRCRSETSATLLCHAARLGNREFVKALLDHGADASIGDHEGRLPQDIATLEGHVEVADLLRHRSVGIGETSS